SRASSAHSAAPAGPCETRRTLDIVSENSSKEQEMKSMARTGAIAAVSILIASSAALGDDRASSKVKARPSWAKVVVNQPSPKRGAYYKGVSRTTFGNLEWPQTR
ncbi:hypothetical protein, partial [Sinorhizobium sp. Sb3]|uniref:hypothetical protein n=2 Tax=Sinorhizobium/Ensifer group TaxID=227292 RepID=UPI001AEC73AA